MSPDPTRPVKKATQARTKAASTGARTLRPSRLTNGLAKELPLSWRTKIRLFLARIWAKLNTWRLRRRARNL